MQARHRNRCHVMPLSTYHNVNASEFDKQGHPLDGYVQDRTILKGYKCKPLHQYDTRVIFSKLDKQYLRFVFHFVEAQEPILLDLNARKMGIFIGHPSVTLETIDIHPEPQNLARYDQKQVESRANSQSVAGPANETQHTRPAEESMTPTG